MQRHLQNCRTKFDPRAIGFIILNRSVFHTSSDESSGTIQRLTNNISRIGTCTSALTFFVIERVSRLMNYSVLRFASDLFCKKNKI